MELSIVLPCLNEAKTLAACTHDAGDAIRRLGIFGEIIVADNDSSDGSAEVATNHGARVISVKEKGFGSAVSAGINAARGRFIIMCDSDGSYDLSEIEPFVSYLKAGFDLVVGNRFKGGIERGAMPFLHRFIGNPFLSGIRRVLFKTPVGDFHCGLRAFHKESILSLSLQSPRMVYCTEMVVKAALHNLKMTEVPIILCPDGRERRSHLRPIRDGWANLWFMLHAAAVNRRASYSGSMGC